MDLDAVDATFIVMKDKWPWCKLCECWCDAAHIEGKKHQKKREWATSETDGAWSVSGCRADGSHVVGKKHQTHMEAREWENEGMKASRGSSSSAQGQEHSSSTAPAPAVTRFYVPKSEGWTGAPIDLSQLSLELQPPGVIQEVGSTINCTLCNKLPDQEHLQSDAHLERLCKHLEQTSY